MEGNIDSGEAGIMALQKTAVVVGVGPGTA